MICIVATLAVFILASYEATFTALPRSTLEKMVEAQVPRAHLMLRIHEPRHRLHLMGRMGQSLGAVAASITFLMFLWNFIPLSTAVAATAIGSFALLLLTTAVRRIRFEEEGEERHVPRFTVTYVPLHALLAQPTRLLERIAFGEYDDEEDFKAAKEEEFKNIVESEQETGVLEEGERAMIEGVVGFHDRVTREVMVPRVDITAVEQNDTVRDLLTKIRETGHSRVPLYEESLDQIRGVIYAKDLLHLLIGRPDLTLDQPLSELVDQSIGQGEDVIRFTHEAYYVPETKKLDELLTDLNTARTQLAIVVDEYGGTAGLVTTEDLVEEIVGEIQDEYDEEEELYHWREPDEVLVVNPRINMDELNELLHMDLPSDGYDTLGGFIYDQVGQVPEEGLTLQVPGLEIEVVKVEGLRIAEVLMRLVPVVAVDRKNGGQSASV